MKINPMFTNWHCVGVYESIDFTKPYVYNVGDLPLVLWKNSAGSFLSTLNVCKHMGSKLNHAKITNSGCLKCNYHGLEYADGDAFGKTVLHEGKLFWSYEPNNKPLPSTPFYNNKNYVASIIELDMYCSLKDSAMNAMDIRHPEYVHNNLFGFGSSIPASNIKYYEYKKDERAIGLYFEYNSQSIVTNGKKITSNFHMFFYPSFTWSRVTFFDKDRNKNLYIGLHMLPVGQSKTKWFVTVCHDYNKSPLQKKLMKTYALSILSQDFIQLSQQSSENPLKKESPTPNPEPHKTNAPIK
jgi:phenylpropionate dioxygenase-like ring-hydroxylating dioxygenase large terminal subunit